MTLTDIEQILHHIGDDIVQNPETLDPHHGIYDKDLIFT